MPKGSVFTPFFHRKIVDKWIICPQNVDNYEKKGTITVQFSTYQQGYPQDKYSVYVNKGV